MNYFLAAASGGLGDTVNQITRTFGLNTAHFIAQVISFCIVAFLLHRFAYKPILKVLAERRERIAQGLANAEKIKAELERTEAARRDIMTQANIQANKLIEEARAAAAKVQETESQKAIAQAEQIIAKAREAAAADHAKMLADLKKEIGALVVRTTAQVAGKVLSNDDQKRLIEETNRQLA